MELLNFSTAETARFNKALTFVNSKEIDIDLLAPATLIVKTENYEDECEQLTPYYACLGVENWNARMVYNPVRGGNHKILVNKGAISGLSYIHSMVTELVHLVNFSRYGADHGNVYRFDPEMAIGQYYYEFLLWTKFQAMKIATRAHALLSWHEVNGDDPPADGCYRFAAVDLASTGLIESLERMRQAADIAVWREGLWTVLEEMVLYFGRLTFYQQEPRPWEVDERFPQAGIEEVVGLENSLIFYALLQQTGEYDQWLEQKGNFRKVIVAMQEQGRQLFKATGD
ncbi:hypothetical protein [Desulfobulbus alkaliphilus]|uniref:hypothetical protein n=1 Tax=Desulfobulbus alkaliphilus TaxID=869814 RepID=UPI0019635ED0|nr:hypothetical protein [Desulfobulbus alkaliphilus]MBM9535838.1 hypothetical protein [Desulfobulbus alkaliphilus]